MMQAIQITCDEGHEEEPHTPAPDTAPTAEATPTKQEGTPTTALAPLEEEVLDGEVTAIIEPDHTPTPKQPPYYLIVVVTIAGCLLFTLVSFLFPMLTTSATILIIPTEQHIATTTAIQVRGRLLPTLTLSQSQTTPATGKRHQDATEAHGTITFYNGLLSSQTISAGTTLTGQDGVEMITDQAARIPPASNTTPPTFGQVTVEAHAVQPGANGNISPYDINGSCCGASILAKNTENFTGGRAARDFLVVTRTDINTVVTSLLITLSQVETAALQAQLHTGEALTPSNCSPHVLTNHKPGEEAREVSVTFSETCSSIAYAAHGVDQDATQIETLEAVKQLGTGYIPFGDTHTTITHATITNQAQSMATLTVKIEATVVYHITPGEKEQMRKLIAGKTRQQAQAILLQLPGIAGAAITIKGNAATLPDNPKAITMVVVERV